MNSILLMLAKIAVLPVAGCIFPGNRDYMNDKVHAPVKLNRRNWRGKPKPPEDSISPIPEPGQTHLPATGAAASWSGNTP
jgi:hypothetical protein